MRSTALRDSQAARAIAAAMLVVPAAHAQQDDGRGTQDDAPPGAYMASQCIQAAW